MRYLFLLPLLFAFSRIQGQVVDSLVINSDLFAVVSSDYGHQFINLGSEGFILYGGVAKPKKKGIAGTTTTFKIYHYDTAFKVTESVIEMPQKVGPRFVYQTPQFVYFLIEPQLSGTGIAYLIKYDLKGKTYSRFTIHNNWKSSTNIAFVVVGNYLYVKYERAENGGYGVLVYRPYLEVYDLTQEKIKDVDLTFKDYDGYELSGINFIRPRNWIDTVFVQFDYKGDGKKNTSESKSRRIQGFYNGRMLMNGVVVGSEYYLNGTYLIGCGDRVNFCRIYPDRDSMYVSLSYLTSSEFVNSQGPVDTKCLPDKLLSGWSFQNPKSSSFTDVYQIFDVTDYQNGTFDKPIHFVKFTNGQKVLDTTSLVFKEAERTVLPYPYYFVKNESQDLVSEFVVSSWQRLYCFKIGLDNRLTEKYSIHLPPHQKEGVESPALFPLTWESFRKRELLASVFDIQYAYGNFYYFISLHENPGYAGYTCKLYKCRF